MYRIAPDVVQAIARDDFKVWAYCDDGTIREIDMKPFIAKGGIYAKLSDPAFFKSRITVLNDTLAWDLSGHYDPSQCIDIAPENLLDAPIVHEA